MVNLGKKNSVVSLGAHLLILLAVVLGLAGSSAWGQADTGRISGAIKDVSGAVIPGVTVVATRTDTGDTTEAKTDKSGVYTFATLRAGTYSVAAKLDGFSKETQENITLNDGGAVNVPFVMKAGSADEITVQTGSVDSVNTQTGEVSHVIDGDTVRDLALNGRNYLDLLGTLPGSVQSGLGDAISETVSGSTTNVNLNGARATSNGLYIDGFINKDIGSNATQFNNVGIDFIEHVKVQTSSFSAEYGSAAGPTVNVVTRSGANAIHGSVFEFLRNNYLDAANYFSYSGAPLGPHVAIPSHLRYNDAGFALGGPIIHDKLFFFIGTEWKLIAQATPPSLQTIPLPDIISGNFRATIASSPSACPATVNPVTGVVTPGLPAGALISTCISSFGRALQKEENYIVSRATNYSTALTTVCSNTQPDLCNGNSIFELAYPFRNHQYSARLDWTINKRQSMYGRWFADTHTTTNPIGSGALPVTAYHDEEPANNVLLSHTYVVSPRGVNEVDFGALFASINYQPYGNAWLRSTYGYSYQPYFVNSSKVGIPSISTYGYATASSDTFMNRYHPSYFQLQDIFTYVIARQTIKVGGLIGRNRADVNGKANFLGSASFNQAPSVTGSGFGDALVGSFDTYTESPTDAFGQYRLTQGAAFVDDVWRVASKLSLNLGVRWEHETPWVAHQDNITDFYPNLYDPTKEVQVSPAGVLTVPTGANINNGLRRAGSGVPSNQLSRVPGGNSANVLSVPTAGSRGFYKAQDVFMPRVGFAYDMFGNGQTSFRGGGGLFYDTPQANAAFSTLILPPYVPTVNIENGQMDNLAAAAGTLYPFGAMYTLDPNFQRTYNYQYNFGIQQQLAAATFMQINYVGAEGRHLLRHPDINGVDPSVEDCVYEAFSQSGAAIPVLDYMRQYTSDTLPTQVSAPPAGNPTGTPVTVKLKNSSACNQLPPVMSNGYGGYGGYDAIYQWRSDVDYNYNSLQANINRRVGKGRYTLTYTFSKALSTGSADTDTNHILLYSKQYNYGPTSFDRRNVITSTYIVQAGPLQRHNRLIREAFASWFMSGSFRFQGGTYNTATGTDEAGVASRANYCGYPVRYGKAPYAYFYLTNPSAPTTPSAANQSGAGMVNFTAPTVHPLSYYASAATAPCGGNYTTGVGDAPLGNIIGPRFVDLDTSFRKTFEVTERYRLTVNFDLFNAFNHPNFSVPTLNVNGNGQNPYLGVGSAGRPRNLSAGARLVF